VGQAKAAPDQTAARKDVLDFLGRGIGGDVEVLGGFPEQQVPDAAANDVSLEARLLELPYDFGRVRAELPEPDSVLGLRNGEEVGNGACFL